MIVVAKEIGMNIYDFIPPILIRLKTKIIRGSVNLPKAVPVAPMETFSSYKEAIRTCDQQIFHQNDYVRVILHKTKLFRDELSHRSPLLTDGTSTPALAFLGISLILQNNSTELGVIDLGGACGVQYFVTKMLLRNFIKKDIKLRWHVVETPATVEQSKELENEELKFFSSIEQARDALGEVDFVHSLGTIQVLPDPRAAVIELIDCNARFLFLGRVGVTLGNKDVIALHAANFEMAGPGPFPLPEGVKNQEYKVPFTFIPRQEFDQILNSNYAVRAKADDPWGIFAVNDEPIVGLSVLAERIDA